MNQVMDCAFSLSEINYKNISTGSYYVVFDSNFTVSPNGATIVGVKFGDNNILQTEDINNDTEYPFEFPAKGHGYIYSVLVDWQKEIVLSGCDKSILKMHSLDTRALIKNFGKINIGWICSCKSLGNLAVVGGKKSQFKWINLDKKKIFHKKDAVVGIGSIVSLLLVAVPENKTNKEGEIVKDKNGENVVFQQTRLTVFGAESSTVKTFDMSDFAFDLTK